MPHDRFPSAEAQLRFLSTIQRLFAESDFSATYKFALLIALADLAVERGADDTAELEITTRQIAERFIQMYWRQALPYGTGRPGTTAGVLLQNRGAQTAVISAIMDFRSSYHAATPQQARSAPAYQALLSAVAQTVSKHPLNYLQNFGGGSNAFLYRRGGLGKVILLSDIMYCLRRYYPLVQQLARGHWVGHIKANRANQPMLGQADDLEDFLFAASRQSLKIMGDGLRRLDGARCFYCANALSEADVDHFVPFSQYPRDLAHNFVLAHPSCNRSKSDTLGARPHLERWLERMGRHGDGLAEIGQEAGFVVDVDVTRQVAAWGYGNAMMNGGKAWMGPGRYEMVDGTYVGCFGSP